MDALSSWAPGWLAPAVTPALIFLARVCDVSLGTVRIVSVARGHKLVAPLLGFFEILVWLLALRGIFENLTVWTNYVAYAGGFATGTWAGLWIESKMALGLLAIRAITPGDASELMHELNERDYGVTSVAARGVSGRVRLVFTVVRRRELDDVLAIIRHHHPDAFLSISDVRSASEGIFPESRLKIGSVRFPGLLRKAK